MHPLHPPSPREVSKRAKKRGPLRREPLVAEERAEESGGRSFASADDPDRDSADGSFRTAEDPEPDAGPDAGPPVRPRPGPMTAEQVRRLLGRKINAALRRDPDVFRTLDLSGLPEELATTTQNPVNRAAMRVGFGAATEGFLKPYDAVDAPAQNAVASFRLAKLLGLPVISEVHFYTIGGVSGAFSVGVRGKPLAENKTDAWTQRQGQQFLDVDLSADYIQKGLSDLQVFDALTGQRDRHANNIYIDPVSRTVTGIDDDYSFGAGVRAEHLNDGVAIDYFVGIPSLIDRTTAKKVLKLTERDLERAITPLSRDPIQLSTKTIEGAKARLRVVQSRVRQLAMQGRLVDTWTADTYAEAIAEPDLAPGMGTAASPRSYLKVNAENLAEVRAGRGVEKFKKSVWLEGEDPPYPARPPGPAPRPAPPNRPAQPVPARPGPPGHAPPPPPVPAAIQQPAPGQPAVPAPVAGSAPPNRRAPSPPVRRAAPNKPPPPPPPPPVRGAVPDKPPPPVPAPHRPAPSLPVRRGAPDHPPPPPPVRAAAALVPAAPLPAAAAAPDANPAPAPSWVRAEVPAERSHGH